MKLTPERARALMAKVTLTPSEADEVRRYVLAWADDHATRRCSMEGCEETVQWQIPLCQKHMASGACYKPDKKPEQTMVPLADAPIPKPSTVMCTCVRNPNLIGGFHIGRSGYPVCNSCGGRRS